MDPLSSRESGRWSSASEASVVVRESESKQPCLGVPQRNSVRNLLCCLGYRFYGGSSESFNAEVASASIVGDSESSCGDACASSSALALGNCRQESGVVGLDAVKLPLDF